MLDIINSIIKTEVGFHIFNIVMWATLLFGLYVVWYYFGDDDDDI